MYTQWCVKLITLKQTVNTNTLQDPKMPLCPISLRN